MTAKANKVAHNFLLKTIICPSYGLMFLIKNYIIPFVSKAIFAPQPFLTLPRLPISLLEPVPIFDVRGVSHQTGISVPDDLLIQHPAILEPDIPKESAVLPVRSKRGHLAGRWTSRTVWLYGPFHCASRTSLPALPTSASALTARFLASGSER
jgi:hypothetical protein